MTNHSPRNFRLSLCIGLLLACLPGLAQTCSGQCHNGCDAVATGVSCGAAGCSGRCTYGIEGTCIPKRNTYGHYQTTWRQWKEPAPYVPKRPKSAVNSRSEGQVELPPAMDESEINPEFPQLKTSATSSDVTGSDNFSMDGSEYFPPTDEPTQALPYDEQIVPASPDDAPAVDLPTPAAEDAFGEPDVAPAPGLDFDSRNRRRVPSRVMRTSYSVQNPLRSSTPDVATNQRASHTDRVATRDIPSPNQAPVYVPQTVYIPRPKVAAEPATTFQRAGRNPLR